MSLDGDRVIFAGTTHAMPTSAGLAIRCEGLDGDQWQTADEVNEAIQYVRKYAQGKKAIKVWGSPEENETFAAWVDSKVFAPGSYRFVWHATMFSGSGAQEANLDLKVEKFDLVISALTTRPYAAEELDGSASTTDGADHD